MQDNEAADASAVPEIPQVVEQCWLYYLRQPDSAQKPPLMKRFNALFPAVPSTGGLGAKPSLMDRNDDNTKANDCIHAIYPPLEEMEAHPECSKNA